MYLENLTSEFIPEPIAISKNPFPVYFFDEMSTFAPLKSPKFFGLNVLSMK